MKPIAGAAGDRGGCRSGIGLAELDRVVVGGSSGIGAADEGGGQPGPGCIGAAHKSPAPVSAALAGTLFDLDFLQSSAYTRVGRCHDLSALLLSGPALQCKARRKCCEHPVKEHLYGLSTRATTRAPEQRCARR
jgi:hypothetical protein